MNKGMTLISGIGLGTGLMYLFDPDRGKRRRARLRDKAEHGLNKTGEAIEQAGVIHFTAPAEGETSVDIHITYNPPGGAIGHLVAMLFGSDPKSEMDEDLMRMKSFIETGHIPHDAAQKQAVAHKAH